MGKDIHELIEIFAGLQKDIRNRFKAVAIGIFGSYACEEPRESSDVDVLVNFHESATPFDFVRVANFLEEKLDLKVDVVPIETIREEIREQVLKEAVYL